MVVSVNEAEMEDNGVFLQCVGGDVWEAVRRGRGRSGCSAVGSPFAVPCGNHPVDDAGDGLEEPTVQANLFAKLLIWSY